MKEFLIQFFVASGIIGWIAFIFIVVLSYNRKPKNDDYEDMEYCSECHRDTLHLVHNSGHERDSSGDWRMCLICQKRK